MTKTPILFIIFNRLDTVRQSFESIRRYKPEKLYIAADGPRKNKEGEAERCREVREWVLGNIDWECEVSTLFRDENVGCGQGPKQAIDWLFANEEMGVILEDDCVASDSFFEFACQMLVKYRDDKRISIICGSNFDKNGDFRVKDADYFFSVVPYTWGWATWRRNWEDYDFSMSKWNQLNKGRLLKFMFKDAEHRNYWRCVFDETVGKNPHDIWDYQFFFSCYQKHQLAIVPNVNLINNIGVGENATHTSHNAEYRKDIIRREMEFPLRHPVKMERNWKYDSLVMDKCYGRIESIPWHKKVKRWIKRIIGYQK